MKQNASLILFLLQALGYFNNNEIQDNVKPKSEIKEETISAKEGINDAFQDDKTVKIFIRSILNNIVDHTIKHCGPRNPKVRKSKRRALVKKNL